MIRFLSSGGPEPLVTPVVVCDVCRNTITEIAKGHVVFQDAGTVEGELLDVMHVHEGRCHDLAEKWLHGNGCVPWHMLEDHLNELIMAYGITPHRLIQRMASWVGVTIPDEDFDIDRLLNWLKEPNVHSPPCWYLDRD
jgi:hypothetical protein